MSTKPHLVPSALLALVLGIFAILFFRRHDPAPLPPSRTDAPTAEKSAVRPGPAAEVSPSVDAGPRVRGRVISESREPVEGARLWIGHGYWWKSKPLGVSAKDGSYDLPQPLSDLPNYQWMHIMADGYRPESRKLGAVVDGKGPTIILHPSPILRGVVLEQGTWRRLGGLIVQAKEDTTNQESIMEVQAREDGTFEMTMLPQGRVFLCVRGVGYKASTAVNGDGSLLPPEDIPPTVAMLHTGLAILALPPLGAALVAVKDEAGKPVAGADVRHLESVKTDADGRARLDPLPEGDEGVYVTADGYAPASQDFKILAHQDTKVEVVLKKGGARLFGTIAVAEGQPEPTSVEVWPGVLGPEGAHCSHPEIHGAVAAGRKYSIAVPHDEPVRLVVRFDGGRGEGRIPWFDRGSVTLPYGQSQERNLVVEPLCKLRIETKDSNGRPIPGASLTWEGGGRYRLERDQFSGTLSEAEAMIFGSTIGNRGHGSGVTDAAGILTVCLVKGDYKVDATHGEFKPHKGQTFPVDGDATREIVLDRALRVQGHLSTWDSKPADGWWVGVWGCGNEGKAVSDGDGAFTLDSVEPGPRKIQVFWPRYIQTEAMSQAVEISDGMGVLELRLPPLPMLRGHLRGFRLQDLGEARFECGAADEQVGYMSVRFDGVPDTNGLFSIGPMPAATYGYTLQVRLSGMPQPYVAARGKVVMATDRETTLDLDCEAPGRIAVEIEIAETSRYDRYSLILMRPNGDYINSTSADAIPGMAGKKRIDLLAPPGEYLVEVSGSNNYREDRSRKVHREAVTLEPSGKVELKASPH